MKNKGKISLWPALFIGPHMLLFVLFFLIPAMIGIYVSMTEWDLYSQPVFVGLDNFRTLLWDTDSIIILNSSMDSKTRCFLLYCQFRYVS